MPSKRKLWKTRDNANPLRERRHESQAATYRYVNAARANHQCGGLIRRITVWVDERDGRGWRLYEHLDFTAEVPDAG